MAASCSRTRTTTFCINQSVVDMLEERLEQCESSNYRQVLRRAIRGVRAFEGIIRSKDDARRVDGVGEHLSTLIHMHLINNPPLAEDPPTDLAAGRGAASESESSARRVRGRRTGRGRARGRATGRGRGEAQAPSVAAPPAVSVRPSGEGAHVLTDEAASLPEQRVMADLSFIGDDVDSPPRPVPRPVGRGPDQTRGASHAAYANIPIPQDKEYIPTYRSAPYAILLALLRAKEEGVPQMRKEDLARSAQQNCDTNILRTGSDDPSTWYTGWSSVNKTLVTKGLIKRSGRPIHFSLTAKGEATALRLAATAEQAEQCGALTYGETAATAGARNLSIAAPSAGAARSGTCGQLVSRSGPNSESDNRRSPGGAARVLGGPSQEEEDRRIAREMQRHSNAEEDTALGRPSQPAERHLMRSAAFEIFGTVARGNMRGTERRDIAARLEREYDRGKEFGAAWPGVLPSTSHRRRQTKTVRRRKFSESMCERASKAIQRLESHGYDRADCIKIVNILYEDNVLPLAADALYRAIANALWELEKQERRQRKTEPIGIQITAIKNRDGDENEIRPNPQSSTRVMTRTANTGLSHRLAIEPLTHSSASPDSSGPEIESNVCASTIKTPKRDDGLTRVQENERDAEVNTDYGIRVKRPVEVIDLDDDDGCCVTKQPATDQPKSPRSRPADAKRRRTGRDVIDLDCDGDVLADGANDVLYDEPPILCVESAETSGQDANLSSQQRVVTPPRQLESVSRVATADSANGPSSCASNPSAQPNFGDPAADFNDSPPVPGFECKVWLLLDSMERFRTSNTKAGHVKSPGDLLTEKGVPVEVRSLPVGDMLFVARFPDKSEVVLDYIIERKTVEDFDASMRDGRVAHQSYLMRQSQIKRQVFLLEGDLRERQDIYEKTELRKKLAEMTICSGFFVKQTSDILDTIDFYASLHRWLQGKFVKQSKATILQNRFRFSDWARRMTSLKKNVTLEQLFLIQLCQIPGVGMTKAHSILKMGYKTPKILYNAFAEMDTQEEKDRMLNTGIHAIGARASRSVSRVFTLRVYPTAVESTPDI